MGITSFLDIYRCIETDRDGDRDTKEAMPAHMEGGRGRGEGASRQRAWALALCVYVCVAK
jgi:hypothetical protein